jgi:hypothetical protein
MNRRMYVTFSGTRGECRQWPTVTGEFDSDKGRVSTVAVGEFDSGRQ